ncbi:hypothetical protein DFH08DRAFT_947282 [Mycena albidolilacea]|uniref:Uncharacterized protein n=1 Tax=Mycena albidolilacea TaxID=1033008 RepID=A0AAD7AUJ3_9AGAR|nr:hypothetical protein DFH08DRAFT_947282 [Mycena albidolilacea]
MNTHAPPVSYNPGSCEFPSSPHSPTTSRGRRPSISNPMHWLSRNSTQTSIASVKSTRISEPKLIHERSSSRAGILGSGATVVRTPDEALRDTRVRLTYDGTGEPEGRSSVEQEGCSSGEQQEPDAQEIEYSPPTSNRSSSSEDEDEIPSPPDSPPLPSVPADEKSAFHFDPAPRQSYTLSARPTRAVPQTPTLVLRPSLKTKRTESPDASFVVPALPSNVSPTPVPPAFTPILLSDAPSSTADRSKIIVSLETCTATFKTTFDTLSSRPSQLSSYLASLSGRRRSDSVASSVYSTESADLSTYRQHLAAQGLLPQSSASLHIFLDRPSEPYVHILNYLRSPRASPEGPEVLPPRAARAGLDNLLELRDEAAYLGLTDLHKLCVEEIRHQHRPHRPRSTRAPSSSGSIHSMHASVSSLHTMVEERNEAQHWRSASKDSVDELGKRSPPSRSLPTESWTGGRHVRSQTRHGSIRSPPAGWI